MPHDARSVPPLGRSHPLVGRVRLLRRSPEERARTGLLLVEGVRLAEEALAEAVPIQEAIIGERLDREPRGRRLLADLRRAGVPVRLASDSLLASLHDAESHQGILMVARRAEALPGDLIPVAGARALVLVACKVQDPGNMGALVRVADASGATGLLAAGGADPFGPKAVRASAGSIFRLPVLRARGISQALEIGSRLKEAGLILAGAAPRGGIDYREADLSSSLALFMGGEAGGLPEAMQASLDLRLTIPMRTRVESINVAAAAAVLLFAASGSPRLRPPRDFSARSALSPRAARVEHPAPRARRRPSR